MAEIKSTMDLIMERTKNLTLTEEEKKAIQAKEVKSRIKGWLQRYMDGALTIRDMKENVERELAAFPDVAALLKEEFLAHLEPETDNEKLFQLLGEVLGIDTAPFRRLIDDFREEMILRRTEAARDALDVLHSQGIGGTAVIPNLNLNPAWNTHLERGREEFRTKLYLLR